MTYSSHVPLMFLSCSSHVLLIYLTNSSHVLLIYLTNSSHIHLQSSHTLTIVLPRTTLYTYPLCLRQKPDICSVNNRTYTGHIPDIYRTYTGHIPDKYRRCYFAASRLHWSFTLVLLELYYSSIEDVLQTDMRLL